MEYLEKLKTISYAGNSGYDYIMALIVFIGLLFVLKIIKSIIVGRLKRLAEKTTNDFDDTLISVFSSVKPPFYFLVSLYFGLSYLTISSQATMIVKVFFLVAVVYEIIKALERIVDYFVGKYLQSMEGDDTAQSKAMVKAVNIIVRLGLWILGITVILSNLGINVTSVIASLGIGGIAVALALQNILSDIFSSFSIYLDKPFKLGDYIVVGEHSGTVEKIGLKTTRIRTQQGQELIMSNNELTNARVENFKRMERRRVKFDLGVVYETKADKLTRIPELIKNIIEPQEGAEFDRCHFKAYGDSALIYEIVYYVDTAEYVEYMNINQEVNLSIFKTFEKEKIEFAYPTQTLFVKK